MDGIAKSLIVENFHTPDKSIASYRVVDLQAEKEHIHSY